MNTKFGIALVIFMLAAVTAVLYLTLDTSGGSGAPASSVADEEKPKTASQGANTGSAPAHTPAAKPTAAPAEESDVTEAEAAEDTPEAAKDGKKKREGKGTITGKVTFVQKKGDMGKVKIDLTLVDWENHEEKGADALVRPISPAADGTFKVDNLPWGTYVALATSTEGFFGIDDGTIRADYKEDSVTLQLFPGGQISGIVKNRQGQPIENARVFVTHYKGMLGDTNIDQNWVKTLTQKSGADGTFAFPYLIDGSYEIVASAKGYGTNSVQDVKLGAKGAEIVLDGAGSASGTVVDLETDDALPNITIKLASRFWMDQYETKSDPQGKFVLTDLPEGEHIASVVHDQYVASADTSKFKVSAGKETTGLQIGVTMGGLITGRVYDKDSGEGLRVALHLNSVNAEGSTAPQISKEQTSSADGSFSFDGLSTGAYRVEREDIKGYPNDWESENRRKLVTLRAGEALNNVDFVLERGLYIAGRLVDAEGNPVTGGYVNGNTRRGMHAGTQAEDDGTFILAGLSPNSEYTIRAGSKDLVSPPQEPIAIGDSPVEGIEIVMTAEAVISGIVVDPAGKPLENIGIIARKTPDNYFGSSIIESEADGAFEVDQLTPGDFDLILSAPGNHNFNNPPTETVTIREAGEKVDGLRLVFDQLGGLTITGRVVNEAGEGISNVNINGYGPGSAEGRSTGDGSFELTALQEGAYHLNFDHHEHTAQQMPGVEAGAKDLQVIMRGRGSIEGTIRDAVSGQPITEFSIVQAPGNQQRLDPWMIGNMTPIINDEGHFLLKLVQEGSATVGVKATGYALTTQVVDGIVAGETVSGVVISMSPGQSVEGVVVDTSGAPVSSALIFIGSVPQEWERDRAKKAVSGSDGSFTLTDVAQGEGTFSAYHPSFAPATTTANIGAGANHVQITLGAGAAVEGTVLINGQPRGDVYVNVNMMQSDAGEQPFNTHAPTDANGYYRIAGLPSGDASITLSIPRDNNSHRSVSEQTTLQEGATARVDFNVKEGAAVLRGLLLESAGATRAGWVNVMLDTGQGKENYGAQIGADGAFEFTGLPAGEATVQGSLQVNGAYQSVSSRVKINEGQEHYVELSLESQIQVTVSVAGSPAGAAGIQVFALRGSHTPPADMGQGWFQTVQGDMAGGSQVIDGQASLYIPEAGAYTLIAFAHGQNGYLGTTSAPLVLTEGQQEAAVSMSF
ncbi:MAG: carboxypeptidase regulatory-like domain-containing protein [Candidatus Hydrogenedentes bacterium]|nr:carboxypeptidase regulatory-like domain-containing protein [Candidatus Hydrogenedentota bacterium]